MHTINLINMPRAPKDSGSNDKPVIKKSKAQSKNKGTGGTKGNAQSKKGTAGTKGNARSKKGTAGGTKGNARSKKAKGSQAKKPGGFNMQCRYA